MRKPWTEEEKELLRCEFPSTKTAELAIRMGRSMQSIYGMASLLKLRKSSEYIAEELKRQGDRLRTGGAAHRFKPGQTPPNKGVKMSAEQYEKAKPTMFKKGSIPVNTLTDGAISIRADSHGRVYKYIRIAAGKWIHLQVYIWKNAHGPVPKGMNVVFKNRDTMDCRLENLELISNVENMKRNTIHNYPEELKEIIYIKGRITRKINKYGKEQNN